MSRAERQNITNKKSLLSHHLNCQHFLGDARDSKGILKNPKFSL